MNTSSGGARGPLFKRLLSYLIILSDVLNGESVNGYVVYLCHRFNSNFTTEKYRPCFASVVTITLTLTLCSFGKPDKQGSIVIRGCFSVFSLIPVIFRHVWC